MSLTPRPSSCSAAHMLSGCIMSFTTALAAVINWGLVMWTGPIKHHTTADTTLILLQAGPIIHTTKLTPTSNGKARAVPESLSHEAEHLTQKKSTTRLVPRFLLCSVPQGLSSSWLRAVTQLQKPQRGPGQVLHAVGIQG